MLGVRETHLLGNRMWVEGKARRQGEVRIGKSLRREG